MATNIQNVDYKAIPSQAGQMRAHGESLNSEMTTAFQSIANMHNSWYGKRYNDLVKLFNEMIPSINELLELVVGDIPFALETIANNYSQADSGSKVTSANKTAPNKITTLTTANDQSMRFISGDVEGVKTNVSNNFKNAIEKMNSIESTYNQIQWQSEAAETFRAKITKLKGDITKAFENIDSQFTTLMTQAAADIEAAENANTVQ